MIAVDEWFLFWWIYHLLIWTELSGFDWDLKEGRDCLVILISFGLILTQAVSLELLKEEGVYITVGFWLLTHILTHIIFVIFCKQKRERNYFSNWHKCIVVLFCGHILCTPGHIVTACAYWVINANAQLVFTLMGQFFYSSSRMS